MFRPMELFAEKRIGTRCAGRFDITAVLGGGGMGTVFAATHAFTGREVALKLLHPDVAGSAAARERFLREARAPSEIDHPGIVPVLDAGITEDGTPYLAFERLHGEDLGAALRRGGIDGDALLRVTIELLSALSAAHDAGLIHRDIKPENVFLERTEQGGERVRLLDFGITRPALEAPEGGLTQTGSLVGTPDYLSPEQAQGGPVDARSDLFSVGGVLFYGLTQRRAFEGENTLRRLVALLTTQAPAIRSLRPEVPEDLAAIVDRSLQQQPSERFDSARAMSAALQTVSKPLNLPPPSPTATPATSIKSSSTIATPPRASAAQQTPSFDASANVRSLRDMPLPSAKAADNSGASPSSESSSTTRVPGVATRPPSPPAPKAPRSVYASPWFWGVGGALLATLASIAGVVIGMLPREPRWTEAQNLEADISATSRTPAVAIHPTTGDVWVAWAEDGSVKVRRRKPEAEWEPTRKLERRGEPTEPVIGIDGLGRALVAWAILPNDRTPELAGIWYSRSANWSEWTSPRRIWEGPTYGGLAIAMSEAGEARLVWEQQVPFETSSGFSEFIRVLQTAHYDGSTWTEPVPVLPNEFGEAYDAKVSIDRSNRGLIVLAHQPRPGAYSEDMWSVELEGATLGEPRRLEENTERNLDPMLAMNESGRAVAAWVRRAPDANGDMELWAARYDPRTGFEDAARIARFWSISEPRAVVDAAGNITVVYMQGSEDLVALERKQGADWDEDPRRVARVVDVMGGSYVQLAGASDGRLTAIWRNLDVLGDGSETVSLWSTTRALGKEWSEPVRLHAEDVARASAPAFAAASDGRAVAAWFYTSETDTGAVPTYQIYAATFEP